MAYATRQMLQAMEDRTLALIYVPPEKQRRSAMEIVTVRRTERSEVGSVAAALAQAFFDDPVCAFAWPNDAKRLRRSERSFAAQIHALWGRREVHTDDSLSSVAVWARPDEWQMPTAAVLRVVSASIRARVRPAALLAYLRTDSLHPDEPHWYLEFLGTVPENQGKGLGGQVLTPVLDRADEEGIPVWAWSSNQRNLAFYHRYGFEVLDELPFASGGPSIYPIRREPRA
jgi:GNAT superfamily N-acetyltransferase